MKIRNYDAIGRFGFAIVLAAATVLPAAAAVTNGVLVLGPTTKTPALTIPYGGAWIPGTLGGHYWQPDTVAGACRVDGLNTLTNCTGGVTSAGQITVGTAPGGIVYVFVPDYSAKSTNVVRYQFDPVKETLGNPLIMNIPNVTSTNKLGGAVAVGRPDATALDTQGNLYVGYNKSGDIIKVPGAMLTTSKTPPATLVATSSDGRGVNGLLFFGLDLYLAETGGLGLSSIPDPSGVNRAPCTAAPICSAVPLSPQISFFPGALATDGNVLYVGDAPLTTPGTILKYDPTLPNSVTNPVLYSQNVPAYTSSFDGAARSQYVGIRGLAFAPNGDLYVADDPTSNLILPVLPPNQGHLWKVALPAATPLTVTKMLPAIGPEIGGTSIAISGTGFSLTPALMSASFGTIPAKSITCKTVTTCTVVSPAVVGGGIVTLTITANGQVVTAGSFSFIPTGVGGNPPTITSVVPNIGVLTGGTRVVVTGTSLFVVGKTTSVTFGLAGSGSVVAGSCTATSCTVISPAGSAGVVDIQLNVNGQLSSAGVAGDKFTYSKPVATLFAWGITAPKGGMTFVPGSAPATVGDSIQGGHMWSSDHSQGFCRHELLTPRVAGFGTPASLGSKTLHAMNSAICDDGSIGSPGQPVYDPRVNLAFNNTTSGALVPAGTHFIYVPDNAVKSTAVWRLTFDPITETIVGVPEAMVPLADVRTLKPNGMALGPDGNLYVTDLTEPNIRQITNPTGDPRTQTIQIVAVTGDGRGANGTIAFAGVNGLAVGTTGDTTPMSGIVGGPQYQNVLFISENRAAAWFDISACPTATGPCATTPILLPSGAFIGGVAADPVRHYVYAADSPGGANATIWRFDLTNPAALAIAYLTGGQLPVAGTPEATVWISQTGVRPWNPLYIPGGTAGFSFAFGIQVDNRNGDLYITGDPSAGARGGFGSAWVAKLIQ